ncbi:MAG: hypothetical protein Q4A41_01430 [Bacillota bacterium]|nr:hypothetical protein [Bacillota bacterium]
MTIEAVIVFPLIILILASFLSSYCLVSQKAFYDYEEGVTFLLSVPQRESTEINGYRGRVTVEESIRLTGKLLSYRGKKRAFSYFKPSRLLYSLLFGD